MLAFDPTDPFPLISPESHSYREAQLHSAEVDRWLGLDVENVEAALIESTAPENRKPLWIGLPSGALLTPYTELRFIMNLLSPRPGQTIIDLGAGYGRLGFVINAHYPQNRFIGYELASRRVAESTRCFQFHSVSNASMIEADLSAPSFTPRRAEYYFLYDYSTADAIDKTLNDLREFAKTDRIIVIGRGRSSRDLIEQKHPWISQVIPPKHFPHFSIYRSHD